MAVASAMAICSPGQSRSAELMRARLGAAQDKLGRSRPSRDVARHRPAWNAPATRSETGHARAPELTTNTPKRGAGQTGWGRGEGITGCHRRLADMVAGARQTNPASVADCGTARRQDSSAHRRKRSNWARLETLSFISLTASKERCTAPTTPGLTMCWRLSSLTKAICMTAASHAA